MNWKGFFLTIAVILVVTSPIAALIKTYNERKQYRLGISQLTLFQPDFVPQGQLVDEKGNDLRAVSLKLTTTNISGRGFYILWMYDKNQNIIGLRMDVSHGLGLANAIHGFVRQQEATNAGTTRAGEETILGSARRGVPVQVGDDEPGRSDEVDEVGAAGDGGDGAEENDPKDEDDREGE